MGLLGDFIIGAGESAVNRMEQSRKEAAEMLKAQKLEEIRRETNRQNADAQHGYRMDEIASQQDRQDARSEAERKAKMEQYNREIAAENDRYNSEQVEAYNTESGQDEFVERGLLSKRGYTDSDVAAMDSAEGPVQPSGNNIYTSKRTAKPAKDSRTTAMKNAEALYPNDPAKQREYIEKVTKKSSGSGSKYNPQTAAKNIEKSLAQVMGGRLDPTGNWALPDGNSQEFSRLNAIAQSIEKKHPEKWNPGELAELVYSNRSMLNSKDGVQKLESLLDQKATEQPSVGGLLGGNSGASAGDVDARVNSIMDSMNLHEWLPDSLVPGSMNVSGTNVSENEMRLHIADMVRQGKSDTEILRAVRTFMGEEASGAGQSKKTGGQPVKISSKEQFDALERGTRFIAPDGSLRVKQ